MLNILNYPIIKKNYPLNLHFILGYLLAVVGLGIAIKSVQWLMKTMNRL